jgi:6-pyruvoyltetrahydropterin/6-carboxytetrahydropterin synthase
MILNLTELKEAVENSVIKWVDHKHLNHDVPWLEGIIPTAEMLVIAFWLRVEAELPTGLLYEVKLHETENNIAIYRGEQRA